jgi:hypothetical protein
MIVPTGIGASIGGYAGDALPSARLLASAADTLIAHPNIMNGATLSWPLENVLYVEGYALDEFASGNLALLPTRKRCHRIGVLLDKAMDDELRGRHLQVANAAKATLGLDIGASAVTSRPIGVRLGLSESGASWGQVDDEEALIDGARKLVEMGCTAIAVVARFPEEEDDDTHSLQKSFDAYRQGCGVDTIAGAEAIVSRVISKALNIPCAHAPAFDPVEYGTFTHFILHFHKKLQTVTTNKFSYFIFQKKMITLTPKRVLRNWGILFSLVY